MTNKKGDGKGRREGETKKRPEAWELPVSEEVQVLVKGLAFGEIAARETDEA